jgi:branched-chain amino acid transport system permease protein
MRFIFKTNYEQDIKLFQHSGHWISYLALLAIMVLLPMVIGNYLKSQLIFVFLYAMVGVALMILTGFTGQASLGHAAFLAIGAYTAAVLQQKGVPFIGAGLFPAELSIWRVGTFKFSLPHLGYFITAGLLAGVVGVVVGFPALRLHGIYLMIATISFAAIVEEILARWESVTHGNEGLQIKALELLGTPFPRTSNGFYYIVLAALVATILIALNVLRSPTGRAFIALRDSETAAKSMGVDPAAYKVKAFGLSAAITGFAGALYAHQMSFISPEMFTLLLSIEFIMVIVIGGIFGLHGAILGAIFIVMVDPTLTWLKDVLPRTFGGIAGLFSSGAGSAVQRGTANFLGFPGLKGLIYGAIIVLFVLFEPLGLYGRWLKLKLYFQLFPMYKKATFKRQKTYVKTERNR